MRRHWILIGTVLYLTLTVVLMPLLSNASLATFFESDASEYSRGAINLLQNFFYTIDGIHPFMEREPGMSVYMASVYSVFGIENAMAFLLTQITFFFLASLFFCTEAVRWYGHRVGGLCFVVLLTSGSILHSIFSASRESLTISLFLLCAGTLLLALRRQKKWLWFIAGLLASALILTYFPLLFLPVGMSVFFFVVPRNRVGVLFFLFAAYVPVLLWAYRNASYDGHFRVIGNQRTAVMWYVRGEQAERVHGLEGFHCLYAEYVSRTWEGRSDACSFNGLMHQRWPKGFDRVSDMSDVAREGQRKIRANLPSYFLFSFFEILELHLPFVGGGFSTTFNIFAAVTAFFLYLGCLFSLPFLFRTHAWLWLVPIVYNTLIYSLTDATPRYLVPFLFLYALLSAIGYTRFLSWFSRKS